MTDSEDLDLPTSLPVVVLPGPLSAPTINQKLEDVVRGLDPDAKAVEGTVRYTDDHGNKVLSAAIIVKLGDGWRAYGEGATDLHGKKSVEFGVGRIWK